MKSVQETKMPRIQCVFSRTDTKDFPKQKQNNEETKGGSKDPESCPTEIAMDISKPLIYTMGIFGLLFINDRNRKWAPLTKVYSTIVLLLLWAKFFRFFSLYSKQDGDRYEPLFFFKLADHLWYFLCAIAATVTYKACMNEKGFSKFILRWSRLLKRNRGCDPNDSEEKCILGYIREMKIKSYTCLAIGSLVFLVNMVFKCYLLFFTKATDFYIHPLSTNHDNAFTFRWFIVITDVYNSAVWAFTPCLFYLIARVISKEFEICCQDFHKAISPDGNLPCLEYFRIRHQEICQLVETADGILSPFNAAAIVGQTCDGMLILYSMVWYKNSLSNSLILVCNGFWLCTCLVYLATIAYGGAYLNHMAHSPLKIIHSIRVTEVSSKLALQMNMFLTKLTGESIGLTALDMFVIDKPTILTIAGAFLTYFIVLVQFQQPADKESSLLDCRKYFLNTTSVF